MKIYIDGLIFNFQKNGGVYRYTDELIKNLLNQNQEVIVFVPLNSSFKSANKSIKIVYLNISFNSQIKIIRFINYLIYRKKIKSYFKKNNISNAIFHQTSYFSYWSTLKRSNIVQIITIHDLTREKFPKYFNALYRAVYIFFSKRIFKRVDLIFTVSESTKKDLISYYNLDPSKIIVSYLGGDNKFKVVDKSLEAHFRKNRNISKPYFLYIGQRAGYKNFDFFLKAFAKWNIKSHYDLVLVGGDRLNEKEKCLIESHALKETLKHFNNVEDEELVIFYNFSTAMVFPSLSEGFGLPLVEAMACGSKVVCSNIPVFKEIGRDIPIYFDPQNIVSIENALNKSLLTSPTNPPDFIVQSYSWQNTISKTVDAYKKLSDFHIKSLKK